MPAPARVAAFRALRALSVNRVDLGEALSRARDPLADTRDRALATDLVMGTLRWRGAIDFQIQQFSAKRLARLDAEVVDALRLGVYQILYLERMPVSAVVNDTVAMVKASRLRSASGFVNAVLRRVSRERETLTWPVRPSNTDSEDGRRALVEYLAVTHSHPAWLVARWVERYGPTPAESWLSFNNRPAATTLAPNRLRGGRDDLAAQLLTEGVHTVPTIVAPHGLTVTSGKALASAAFRNGACIIQDEASQIIPELAGAVDGDDVLDACASPGGKTLALAAQSATSGHVVAADVRPRRVALLAATMRRCRVPSVHIVHIPVTGALPFRPASFDRVLVDAPCSGLGTLRRDPDIRWRREAADLPVLASAQRELLDRIAPVVAVGGRLVYSTCSSEPEENEEVVEAFRLNHPEFTVIPLWRLAHLDQRIRALATPGGYLRTTPVDGLEAFFGAVLERRAV